MPSKKLHECVLCDKGETVLNYRKSLKRHYVTAHKSWLPHGGNRPFPMPEAAYEEALGKIRRRQVSNHPGRYVDRNIPPRGVVLGEVRLAAVGRAMPRLIPAPEPARR